MRLLPLFLGLNLLEKSTAFLNKPLQAKRIGADERTFRIGILQAKRMGADEKAFRLQNPGMVFDQNIRQRLQQYLKDTVRIQRRDVRNGNRSTYMELIKLFNNQLSNFNALCTCLQSSKGLLELLKAGIEEKNEAKVREFIETLDSDEVRQMIDKHSSAYVAYIELTTNINKTSDLNYFLCFVTNDYQFGITMPKGVLEKNNKSPLKSNDVKCRSYRELAIQSLNKATMKND